MLNPLVNFNPRFDYNKPSPVIPIPAIKRLTPMQPEKQKVEFRKNRNSRKANEDMSATYLFKIRVQKVFDVFSTNKDLFLENTSKRFLDKTSDTYKDSVEKYENAHEIILHAVSKIKDDWCEFLDCQSARNFS